MDKFSRIRLLLKLVRGNAMRDILQQHGRLAFAVKVMLAVIGLAILLWTIYLLKTVLLLLVVSALLAAVLYPGVAWLKKRRFSQSLSILIFYLVFIALSAGALYFAGMVFYQQGKMLLQQLPTIVQSALSALEIHLFSRKKEAVFASFCRHTDTFVTQSARILGTSLNYLFAFIGEFLGYLRFWVLHTFSLPKRITLKDSCSMSYPTRGSLGSSGF
jgi:predicted PurR-regulated permease PerM